MGFELEGRSAYFGWRAIISTKGSSDYKICCTGLPVRNISRQKQKCFIERLRFIRGYFLITLPTNYASKVLRFPGRLTINVRWQVHFIIWARFVLRYTSMHRQKKCWRKASPFVGGFSSRSN